MNNLKQISRILLLIFLVSSCTAHFEQTNTNPDSFDVPGASAEHLFPTIYLGSANDMAYSAWFWNHELVQYTTFAGGTTRNENIYSITDANWLNRWNLYAKYANNSVHMLEVATRDNDDIFAALSLTWKVFHMSELTSMFGDIPYAEAFKGRTENLLRPKFDTQKEVFQQMFEELEQANTLYQSTKTTAFTGVNDYMYSNNIAKWRKFNNSIYLRLLMRVSGRTEMNVGAKITEIINNPTKYPIITSNAENAKVTFIGTDPLIYMFNPTQYSEADFTSAGRHLTEQVIKMMTFSTSVTDIDPRLPIYGTIKGSSWKGAVAGCPIGERSSTGCTKLNYETLCRADGDYTFISYDELMFIFAECALKGYISGGKTAAKDYYEKAITASMEKWSAYGAYMTNPVSISQADITAYLARPEVEFDIAKTQAELEELLANQKYLALFWVGMEGWHEYRRTGYPELVIGTGTLNDHILPTRFAYPTSTMATNAANANAALQNMGGANDMKTPVWWSKQAIGN